MANVDRANGLRWVGTLAGGVGGMQTLMCYKAAGTTVTHDLYIGDTVAIAGASDTPGVMSVVKGAAAAAIFGAVVGVQQDPDQKSRGTWIDGAGTGYVYVCTDPLALYEIQANDVVASADIGRNADLVATAGDRSAGRSGFELDVSSIAVTATLQLRIIGIVQREDNTINSADNKVLVKINNSSLQGGTGTVGI